MRRAVALLVLLGAVAAAGEKQLKLFEQVWKQIQDEYYDLNFNGVDWRRVRERYQADALRSTNDREIYAVLDKMAAELKDAHTRVISPREAREDRTRNRQAFGFGLRLVEGQYVVTHVEPKSPLGFAGLQPGWLLRSVDESVAPATAAGIAGWYAKAAIRDKCLAAALVKFEFLDAQDHRHALAGRCATVNTVTRQEALRVAGGSAVCKA